MPAPSPGRGTVHYYHLFGGIFGSTLEFPELPAAAAGPADWRLTRSARPPPAESLPRLGSETVTESVEVVLSASPSTYRLDYQDTGTFLLTDHGREITWHPPPGDPSLDDVRRDVLGRVMAVALHASGIPTLHGSGVALDGAGVAFVAPKRHGKSTIAAAVVRAGGRLLGDDLLALTTGDPPLVLPAVPTVRLWRDSVERLSVGVASGSERRKAHVGWDGLGERAADPVPLSAIYLLHPVRPEGESRVSRERLSAVRAAVALLGQTKIGALLGRTEAGRLLDQLASVSSTVPVYRLTVPRELDRLDELVERVAGWHDPELRLPVQKAAR